MITWYTFIPLITCIVNTFLIGYVIGRRTRSSANLTFLAFLLVATTLTFIEFLNALPVTGFQHVLIIHVGMFGLFMLGFLFVHFVYALIGKKRDVFYYGVVVLVGIPLVGSLCTPLLVVTVTASGAADLSPVPQMIPFFLMGSTIPFLYSSVLCLITMRTSPDKDLRSQISLLFWGTFLSGLFVTMVIVVFPLILHIGGPIRISSLSVLIQSLFIYRAISRYNLLSVDIQQIEDVSSHLFDNLGEIIVLLDRDGDLIRMNQAAVHFFGVHKGITRTYLEQAIPGWSFATDTTGTRFTCTTGDTHRTIVLSQSVMQGGGGKIGKIIIARDITDQTALEEEISRSRHIESIGVLAAGIAHDFNNFLTGIAGSLSLVKHDSGVSSETLDIVSDGEKATFKAAQLTQQLLTFAKGGMPIRESFNIREVIEETARFTLRGSRSTFTLSIPEPVAIVDADKHQIAQVIHNLVLNADQAMPDGGIISISADEWIAGAGEMPGLPPGNYVELRISDTGVGIPVDLMPRIFDPYFTTKDLGTGLGLTTVYSIVHKHGGHIAVESKPQRGTTFKVYLLKGGAATPVSDTLSDTALMTGGYLMVVDDDPLIRKLLGRLLHDMGFAVQGTHSGESALELFSQAGKSGIAFRAFIIDLTLPGGISGTELAKRLLDKNPNLCLIVSSGYSHDPVLADFGKYGFRGALSKPYRVDELREVLAKALAA